MSKGIRINKQIATTLTLLGLIVTVGFMLACGPKLTTKKESFPNIYDEKPLSILVLPPINMTTAADAKEYYATTIAEPVSLAGYYIYPIEVTTDILKAEGLYDTELLVNLPPQKFKQHFGADAVMYIKILKWDTAYFVLGGSVTVSVDFSLKSTTTGKVLWAYDGTMKIDTTGSDYGVGGWAGMAIKLMDTAVKTAITDYVPVAKKANIITVSSMPFGKYHQLFDKDRDEKVILKDKPEEKGK